MWDGAFFILAAVSAFALGFFLPGLLVSRLLAAGFGGLHASVRWAVAFIISLLLLFHLIFWWCAVAGLPVKAVVIWPLQLLVVLGLVICVIVFNRRRQTSPIQTGSDISAQTSTAVRDHDASWWILMVMAGLIVAMLLMRMILYPLSGADIPIRWDYLATRILKFETLSFYPPVTDEDFQRYFYIDGIPPLVSFAYWWIYASVGRHATWLTSIFVIAQYAAISVFVYAMSRTMHSPRAGAFAVAALACSPLFKTAVGMGQETGFTALSLVAMMYLLIKARECSADSRWQLIVLAGAAAALGAMAREYGWAFMILGAVAVFWLRMDWRMAVLFCVAAILLASPWYVRNLVRTGNPLYNNRFGPFPVNPVQAGLLDVYVEKFGVSKWTLAGWTQHGWVVFQRTALQFTAGLIGAVWLVRKWGFLTLAIVAVIALWLQSIGYTNGGPGYAVRVLSPVLALLSVFAGVFLASVTVKPIARWACTALVLAMGVHSLLGSAFYPFPIELARWRQLVFSVKEPEVTWRQQLPQIVPAGSSVLTDNPYVAAALEGTSIQAVPIWSPKLRFLLDNSIAPQEMCQRVRQLGIDYVIVENHINFDYLSKNMRFYAEDSASWKVIAQLPNTVWICELPDVVSAK